MGHLGKTFSNAWLCGGLYKYPEPALNCVSPFLHTLLRPLCLPSARILKSRLDFVLFLPGRDAPPPRLSRGHVTAWIKRGGV